MAQIEDNGDLITTNGKHIPALKVGPNMFIDRTIAIYGPSKTGKTVITKHIMKTLNGHIDQILVIAPSESSNRSYEGFVDKPYIHYRLYQPDPANPKKDDGIKGSLRFLESIWKRQEMMAAIYTKANNHAILGQLFEKLTESERSEGMRYINRSVEKRAKVIREIREKYSKNQGRCDEKIKNVQEKFKKFLILIYKKYIAMSYEILWDRNDLSEDERCCLQHLHFNPRLLLIFDDCAAQLKPFFNKDVFRLLFYQNRHSFITVVLCCQDDTDLPANLRKNAFLSFFTEPVICTANFGRQANQFSKHIKNYIEEVIPDVFKGHRKMAYIREDDEGKHFYHVLFPYPEMFRFGSDAMHELSDEVCSEGVTMDKENPYFDYFKLT